MIRMPRTSHAKDLTIAAIAGMALCTVASFDAIGADDWKRSAALGLTLTDGNSETLLLNASVTSERETADTKSRIGIEGNYGENTLDDGTEETTAQNVKAFASRRKGLSERTYGLLDASLAHDDLADVDYRLILGPGLGTFLMKDDDASLGVDVSAMYIREELGTGAEDDTLAIRFGERYDRKLSETAKMWQSVEFLPAADDFDDYLLNAELGIEAAVTETTGLRVVAQDNYDAIPSAGRDKNDLRIIAALTSQF